MRTIQDARKALKTVGFEILHDEDLAERTFTSPLFPQLFGMSGLPTTNLQA